MVAIGTVGQWRRAAWSQPRGRDGVMPACTGIQAPVACPRLSATNLSMCDAPCLACRYGAFVQHLGAGLDVRLQQVVTTIEYDKSKQMVSVTASDAKTAKAKKGNSSTFTARAVVVTLPLGVLQDSAVTFTPTLPPSKLAAIDRLGVAVMNKVTCGVVHKLG